MEQEVNNHHSKLVEELYSEFKSSEKGLTSQEAEIRLEKFGKNEISKQKETPGIVKFLKQFHSPLIYILFVAMAISFVFHHLVDAYVILAVVLINATIGFIQERKAERAIKALEKLIVSYAKVIRDGEEIKIPSSQLVPGDIIILEEGDKVPADARLIQSKDLRTQESSLTGESFPQEKEVEDLQKSTSLADRINMAFMSTLVVSGYAKAIVVATSNKTQIGQVAESLQKIVQPKMHLNKKISQLSIQMAIFAIIGASLTFIIGFFMDGLEFIDIFLFTIASLVSGIPEGLPAVIIIVLAVGANRMAKRNALIRHLPAVETLGVATVIATDKTGTLTQNSIEVENILTSEGNFSVTGDGWEPIGKFYQNKSLINPQKFSTLKKLLEISTLCNKGNLLRKNGNYEVIGDPTEVSLLVLSKKAGLDKNDFKTKIIDDLAFSSESKFRATLVENSTREIFSIGAFEKILNNSRYLFKDNKKTIFSNQDRNEFLKKAEQFAKKGMRVLALGYKEVDSKTKAVSKEDVNYLVLVGIVAMKDPPRKNIKDSIQKARDAGIRVIMKTGDHKETAIAIAKEIGLVKDESKVLTENDLHELNWVEFKKAVKEVDIFARVTPKTKAKIVRALQEQGEIVAMTGDGVNDAPALKRSDVGIAMGIIGTDVARESAQVVLADDNFTSIVNAIEEGRIVFQNIRQTSFYLVTTNVAEDITIVSSLALGFPLPMLPIQLLYLNLVTDTFNGIGLAMEPGHHDVLNQKPRDKKEKILDKELIGFLVIMAVLMACGTIPLFKHFIPHGIDKARTIAFTSMTMFQLFNVFNMRSLHKSIFKLKFFSNKYLIGGLLASFALLLLVIYTPLAGIFDFIALNLKEFLLIVLITSSVLIVGEIYKKFVYARGK